MKTRQKASLLDPIAPPPIGGESDDVIWAKEGMERCYRDAWRSWKKGILADAGAVPVDVVAEVSRSITDRRQSDVSIDVMCAQLSRYPRRDPRRGEDIAVALILSAHDAWCRAFENHGGRSFWYRARMVILLTHVGIGATKTARAVAR